MGTIFTRHRPWPVPTPPPPSPMPTPPSPLLTPLTPSLIPPASLTPPFPSPMPPTPSPMRTPLPTLPPPSLMLTQAPPPTPIELPLLLTPTPPPSTTPHPPGALLPSAISQTFASPTACGVPPAFGLFRDRSPAPLPSPATSPCPCAAPPQQGFEKVAALFGMAFPLALSILPYLYLVYSGSIDKTTKLFGTPAMIAGLINSIFWLIYSITVIKIGQSLSLLILHSFVSMSSFSYLMCVYAGKKDTAKGYFLGGSFLVCLSVIFTVLQWTQNPSEVMIAICGIFGLISLFLCHAIQLKNMGDIAKRSEKIVTAVNVFPDCLINLSTLIITVRRHPEHYIILASALLGFIFNVVEIIVLSIIALLGYFRPPQRNNDVEDPRIQMPNLLRGAHAGDDSSAIASDQDVARTPSIVVGPAQKQHEGLEMVSYLPPSDTSMLNLLTEEAPTRNDSLARLVGALNFIHGSNLENQEDAACYVIIRQTTSGCEIFTLLHLDMHMRVIIEAIPQTMIGIERDMYIPMLLQASGIIAEEPYSILIVKLEIHHWMLMWRRLFLRAEAQIEALTETIARLIGTQVQNGRLKRKRPMEQHEPYKKRWISELQDN